MVKLKKTLFMVIPVLLIGLGAYWLKQNSKKIGYVNNSFIYDGFKLKKELETKYNNVQLARQNLLDSIKFKIQYISLKGKLISENDRIIINDLQRSYLTKEKEFNRDNQLTADEYSNQIWKQINQFISDYGKENNFDYILGATGQGNIMYSDEKNDISKDVLNYINNKYAGEK